MVQKIGIIGAGIAGLSAANILVQDTQTEVFLFEKDRIGGRVKTLIIDEINTSLNHDVGAEFFISRNTTLLQLLNRMGIEYEPYLTSRAILLENGKSVILPSKQDSIFSQLFKKWRLLRFVNFKVRQLTIIKEVIDEFSDRIDKLYAVLDNCLITDEAFAIIKKEYSELIEVSMYNYLSSRGIGTSLIDKFIDPLLRAVYMLGTRKINAFVALMAFAGKNYGIYRIKGGNYSLIEALRASYELGTNTKSNQTRTLSSIIKERVTKIEKLGEYKYQIYSNLNKYEVNSLFVAVPLSSLNNIEFSGFSPREMTKIKNLQNVKYNDNVYHYSVRAVPKDSLRKILKSADTVYTNDKYLFEINKIAYDYKSGFGYFDLTCNASLIDNSASTERRRKFSNSVQRYFDEIDNPRKFQLISSVHWNPAYPLYTSKLSMHIPTSNLICNGVFMGTDNIITSLDSSVRIANSFVASLYELERIKLNPELIM